MAIVWSQNIEGNHYEVRSAGATLRLYRNGVNHSQWNPNRPLSGCIWDLIALPTLYRPAADTESVLVLGFGAGTVARQLRELVEPERIVGLDLDPVHLSIADGFFDCAEGCEFMAADAVEWVNEMADDADESYDVIIDDLYGEENGMPVRYAPMDPDWFQKMGQLLSDKGVLILNLVEPDRVKHLAPMEDSTLAQRFPYVQVHRIEGYENRIVAMSAQVFDSGEFEQQLQSIYRKYPRCRGVAKRYVIETLRP